MPGHQLERPQRENKNLQNLIGLGLFICPYMGGLYPLESILVKYLEMCPGVPSRTGQGPLLVITTHSPPVFIPPSQSVSSATFISCPSPPDSQTGGMCVLLFIKCSGQQIAWE